MDEKRTSFEMAPVGIQFTDWSHFKWWLSCQRLGYPSISTIQVSPLVGTPVTVTIASKATVGSGIL